MKRLLIPVIALLALAACGEDPWVKDQQEKSEAIRECIAQGGTPSFTSDRNGDINAYFGCSTP